MLFGIPKQLQTPGNRHDLAPLCHMGRGNIDDIAVLIPVAHIKAKILKDGAALDKRWRGERNGWHLICLVPMFRIQRFYKRAQKLQKTLNAGAYHNIIGRAQDISAFPDIDSQSLAKIQFSLGFSVSQHPFILAQCTFDIAAP